MLMGSMAKRKSAPWFLRYGPTLVPFSLKGWAFFLAAIAAAGTLGKLGVEAADDAQGDARLYVAGFVGVLLLYFVVGFLRSEGPSVRTSAGRKSERRPAP